jgi:thiol-disulfide isomerase/thioredoxin
MPANPLTGLIVAVVVLGLAALGGVLWRRRDGKVRQIAPPPSGEPAASVPATLGLALASPVTLLQFSSPVCAPCRVARRTCVAIAAEVDGVAHREIDAEAHLDVARELGIWRTPTILVVDARGRIAHRASGVPAQSDLRAAAISVLAAA